MKIKCEKCSKDLTIKVNNMFENFNVGYVTCECGKLQKRYISEADLLLYFGFSEIVYEVCTVITLILIELFGITAGPIILFGIMLVGSFYLMRNISSSVYEKGYAKSSTMFQSVEEDADAIKKSMRWQQLLFFVLVIMVFNGEHFKLFFLAAATFSIFVTFLKYKLAVKNELEASGK